MGSDPAGTTFTELFVDLCASGARLDAATFDRLWRALRAALVTELRRRDLWRSPPSYLGVYGAGSWEEGLDEAGTDPLDELTADCFTFVFSDRRRALGAQLEVRDNIDGLVFLNVQHFVYERQRAHDPLGFLVFDAVRTAVRRAVEAGELEVLGGDPRVRNETVLGFRYGAGPAEPRAVDLPALVRGWNDELVPDLVTARGRGRQPVLGSLQRRLRDLRAQGLEAIRFKDLIDPLKEDVRARWAALMEREARDVVGDSVLGGAGEFPDREPADAASWLAPGLDLESRQSYRALLACICEGVEGFDGSDAARRHLIALWGFLRTWAAGLRGEERLPSGRKLASFLGIPRERLPELHGVLRRLAAECEAEIALGPAARARAGAPRPQGERRPA